MTTNKRWRIRHPESQKEYDRRRYLEQRDERLKKQREYYQANREEILFKKRNGLIR